MIDPLEDAIARQLTGLPDKVMFNGPMTLNGVTVMLFTDCVTGKVFTLAPAASDFHHIHATASGLRKTFAEEARRDAQFL